jgi:hypothetical protein
MASPLASSLGIVSPARSFAHTLRQEQLEQRQRELQRANPTSPRYSRQREGDRDEYNSAGSAYAPLPPPRQRLKAVRVARDAEEAADLLVEERRRQDAGGGATDSWFRGVDKWGGVPARWTPAAVTAARLMTSTLRGQCT